MCWAEEGFPGGAGGAAGAPPFLRKGFDKGKSEAILPVDARQVMPQPDAPCYTNAIELRNLAVVFVDGNPGRIKSACASIYGAKLT